LLLRLRELGLITYPAPLLGGLLEKLPEVLAAEVLARLVPTDMLLFGQAGRACRAAVVALSVQQAAGEESVEQGEEEEDEEEDEEDDEEEEEAEGEEENEEESLEEENEEEEMEESLEEGSMSDEGTEGWPLPWKFLVTDFAQVC